MKEDRRAENPPKSLMKGLPIFVWLLLLVTLFLTFTMSFYSSEGLTIDRTLTLKNYRIFFTDPIYSRILFKSLWIALAISFLAILASYPLAYMVSFKMRWGRNLLFMLCIIPLRVSYLVRIIAWRSILGNRGVLNGFLLILGIILEPLSIFLYNRFAIAVTLTYICIPFVFIPVYKALEKIPRNLVHAANDHGAGEYKASHNVVLPLSLPALVTGFIYVFIIALGDYIIPQQLGAPRGSCSATLYGVSSGSRSTGPSAPLSGSCSS
jgi:spermidine/putrescine transport system permease protein